MPESADLVLSNPPFLEEGQARISPDRSRAAAHALPAGGLEAWLKACTGLLKPKGRLVLIHRAAASASLSESYSLLLARIRRPCQKSVCCAFSSAAITY